jgi:nucleotide-binding universal stress UspA family protein
MRALIAVDLDHHPERVVDHAGAWVTRFGAVADVAYAYDPPSTWMTDPTSATFSVPGAAAAVERSGNGAAEAVTALLRRLPPERQGRARVLDGRPIDVIPAEATVYDLVIVGTHARDGLRHLLLGSVAERVIRASPKPVLVVRGAPVAGRALCAVDVEDDTAESTLRSSVPWFEAIGGAIDLAYVETTRHSAADGELLFPSTLEKQTALRRAAHATGLERLRDSLPEPMRGAAIVRHGDPPGALADLALDRPLGVVFTHGRVGLQRWWLGSVAETFVRMADCSVLVLRRAE